MLANYLAENLVRVVEKVSSVDEAISLSGQLLLDQDYITDDNIRSMKETYQEFGPYMVLVDGVALFHGKPSIGVKKAGLSLLILNERFEIPDSKKSIKLCFSFSSIDKENHMEMIKAFAGLLIDEERLNALLAVNNKEDALNIIKDEKGKI